ncbi:uncharacterized protein LTR77_005363 [Saxophila tyrrhenica]|uniref:Uncharacterized protein n=1 Tax=Saxophila tyrrhenica TaxID=1690608 RepID=A0AAV9P8A4_9PEZI|nr:hypothetical protein LTR77_005363 [Saxophila tyrrhenica]
MAPVIWGLDLAEIKWSKFKSSYMWNSEYHMRRTKFIVYQCALIFCVVSESLGTAALSDYVDMQTRIQGISASRIHVYNDDYVGAASFNIFAGVFVAFIFGAAFFFDLIWPERKESKGVRIAWKVCGVLAVVMHLAAALTLTVITARHRAFIRGDHGQTILTEQEQRVWWRQYSKHSEAPLIYRHNPRAIAAVVFSWIGWCSLPPSCVLLYLGIDNTEKGPGPKSAHARARDASFEEGQADSDAEKPRASSDDPEANGASPSSTHAGDGTYDAPAPVAEQAPAQSDAAR